MKRSLVVLGITLALLVLFLAPNASAQGAQDITHGFGFLNLCKFDASRPPEYMAAVCHAYVGGVTDALQVTGFIEVPEWVTSGQIRLIVIKYLEDHPADLEKPTATLMFNAFMKIGWGLKRTPGT
jgi:hypothetical protein